MPKNQGVTRFTVLGLDGISQKVGTPVVTVLQRDSAGNVSRAQGITVPTDADAGYAVGCLFTDTDSGVGATAYVNEGSATSADFNLMSGVLASSPNITGNLTWTKEVNHTDTVTTTTTSATAGGNLTRLAGIGVTTGAGGNVSSAGGAGGNDAVGGTATLIGGAAGGGNNAGGAALVTGGAGAGSAAGGAVTGTGGVGGETGAGGAFSGSGGVGGGTSGAGGAASLVGGAAALGNSAGGEGKVTGGLGKGTSAGGAVTATSGAASNGSAVNPGASGAISLVVGVAGTATTGIGGAGGAISLTGVAGGASTSASSVAGAGSAVAILAGAGGASSGGSDTGGAGGSMVITSGAGGTGATAGVAGQIFLRSTNSIFVRTQGAPTAKTTSATLTAAEVFAGIITVNQQGAGTSAQQMPNAAALEAALPAGFTTNDSFDFSIINISTVDAEDASLTSNTGVTMVGNMDIHAYSAAGSLNSSGRFRVRRTGSAAFSVYRIS